MADVLAVFGSWQLRVGCGLSSPTDMDTSIRIRDALPRRSAISVLLPVGGEGMTGRYWPVPVLVGHGNNQ